MFHNEIVIGFVAKESLSSEAIEMLISNIDTIERFGLRIGEIRVDRVTAIKKNPDQSGDSFNLSDVQDDGFATLIRIKYVGKRKNVKNAKAYFESCMRKVSLL